MSWFSQNKNFKEYWGRSERTWDFRSIIYFRRDFETFDSRGQI